MFNSDIEQKIVDFIKKSPLGVTSSEIASNFGLNRMTITKYLAIIREKALIDFKQFGMAKLWFIPVKLNKEGFLAKLTSNLILNLPKNELKNLLEKAGIGLGEEINRLYLNFYDTEKLSFDQVCDTYSDIGKKLEGSFKVIKTSDEKISVEIVQLPFEEKKKEMTKVLSIVFAKIASINLGYARVFVTEPKENGNAVIDMHLKKEDSVKG